MILGFDPDSFERILVGGLLVSIAVGVAFGPELKRSFARMRSPGLSETATVDPQREALSERRSS